MIRFTPGNTIELLRSGGEFFPALIAAVDAAEREVWIETYIFADDAAGNAVAEALRARRARGVVVRVLVDGWGARHYLTKRLERALRSGGVQLMKYRPEVAPWQFRSHRLRRLHRKLCHVDRKVAFVGGINIIDDMNTPRQRPPRLDFAVRVRGPLLAPIVQTMQRLWALVELVQLESSDVPLFPDPIEVVRAGDQTAKFVIRDNLRYRRDIERAYLAAIRTAKREIVIANAYFFPGVRFRRALIAAAPRGVSVTLLLQARVEYRLLHYASRALYGQLLAAGVVDRRVSPLVPAREGRRGRRPLGDRRLVQHRSLFAAHGARGQHLRARPALRRPAAPRAPADDRDRDAARRAANAGRALARRKAITWIAYGMVRVMMGLMGYGGEEWFPRRKRASATSRLDEPRPRLEGWRNRKTERSRGRHVDEELELAGLLDRQAGGLGSLQELVDEDRRAAVPLDSVRSVGDEAPGFRELVNGGGRRQAVLQRELGDRLDVDDEHRGGLHEHSVAARLGHPRESGMQLGGRAHFEDRQSEVQRRQQCAALRASSRRSEQDS